MALEGRQFLMSEVPLYPWRPEAHHKRIKGSGINKEREYFIDNLLVRIHLIIEMILIDRPCIRGV